MAHTREIAELIHEADMDAAYGGMFGDMTPAEMEKLCDESLERYVMEDLKEKHEGVVLKSEPARPYSRVSRETVARYAEQIDGFLAAVANPKTPLARVSNMPHPYGSGIQATRKCVHCGSDVRPDEGSCGCFDNGCQ